MSLFIFQYPSRHWTSKDANRIIYCPMHVITRDTLLPPARSKYSKIKFKSSIHTPQGSRRIPTECSWIWMRKWSSSESRSQQKIRRRAFEVASRQQYFCKREERNQDFPMTLYIPCTLFIASRSYNLNKYPVNWIPIPLDQDFLLLRAVWGEKIWTKIDIYHFGDSTPSVHVLCSVMSELEK